MNVQKPNDKSLKEVMELIDKAADLMENGADEDSPELREVQSRLRELTGKSDLDVSEFREYWGWTSLEALAETILMPEPEKSGLSGGR